jgi:O-antigen ligase
MRRASRRRKDSSYFASRALVALAVLNVNNIVYMTTGERQVVSLVLLCVCSVLILRVGSRALALPFLAFATAIGAYLSLGAIHAWSNQVEITAGVWQRYAATLLTVWAVAAYSLSVRRTPEFDDFLRFIQGVLVIAVASVWLTPLLTPLWTHLPLAYETRLSGVFANPNEAGFVCAFALAFALFRPSPNRLLQYALFALAFGGVILSFSKAAVAAALLIIALAMLKSFRSTAVLGALALTLAALLVVPNLSSIAEWTADQTLIPLAQEHRERAQELSAFLSGQFDERVSTGRSKLWDIGWQRITEQFPFGSGLETFLELEGGLINPLTGNWQGVHNVFLLIWGESGFLPLLFTVIFFSAVALRLRSNVLSGLGAALLLVILFDFSSNHSALALRYSNVMLGLLIAIASLPRPLVRE